MRYAATDKNLEMRDWFDLLIDRIDEIMEHPLMQWRGWMFIAPFVGGLTAAIVTTLISGEWDWGHILPFVGGFVGGWLVVALIAYAWKSRA